MIKILNMNTRRSLLFCFISIFLFSITANSQNSNWTHFRGSNLNGIAETAKVPLIWNESVIKWKTSIHDDGYSSPVVFDNQIWVTTATPDGKALYAVCTDFTTGKIIYDIKVIYSGRGRRKTFIKHLRISYTLY